MSILILFLSLFMTLHVHETNAYSNPIKFNTCTSDADCGGSNAYCSNHLHNGVGVCVKKDCSNFGSMCQTSNECCYGYVCQDGICGGTDAIIMYAGIAVVIILCIALLYAGIDLGIIFGSGDEMSLNYGFNYDFMTWLEMIGFM